MNNLINSNERIYPVVYTAFRGWGDTGRNGEGVLLYTGEIKSLAFLQTQNASKNFKKSMKIL